jgi:hypothetical protein
MDELMDMIVSDESPSQISDKIKDILFAKTAEKIDAFRPAVASSLFADGEVEEKDE